VYGVAVKLHCVLTSRASEQLAALYVPLCILCDCMLRTGFALRTLLIVLQMLLGVGKGFSSSGHGRGNSDGYDQYDLNSKVLYVSTTLTTQQSTLSSAYMLPLLLLQLQRLVCEQSS
jgi:hypothetical protein